MFSFQNQHFGIVEKPRIVGFWTRNNCRQSVGRVKNIKKVDFGRDSMMNYFLNFSRYLIKSIDRESVLKNCPSNEKRPFGEL